MKKKKKWIGMLAALAAVFSVLFAASMTSVSAVSSKWIDPVEREPMQEGEYSLILVGDTQKTVEYYPEYMTAMTEWVAANAEALNLKYLIAVGDIVDDVDTDVAGSDPDAQLTAASNAYRVLEEAGVPYALVLGNHDYEDMAFAQREMTKFNEYFPLSRYENLSSLAGSMNDTVENTYHYFEAAGQKYMILALGHHPTDEMIAWGNEVILQNPDRKVIVVTHGYMNADGNGSRTPRGEYLWQNMIRKHANIEMVCCGHELGEDSERIVQSVEYGDNGNAVQQFMTNPADLDYGGAGLIVILRYRLNGRVEVDYYSPKLDQAFGEENQYEFEREIALPRGESGINYGNAAGCGIEADFTSLSEGDLSWQNTLYAADGITQAAEGLSAASAEGASLTYLLKAEAGAVFKGLTLSFEGIFPGGLCVQVSEDNVNYRTTRYACPQPSRQSGLFKLNFYALNREQLYVRVVFGGQNAALEKLKIEAPAVTLQNAMDSDGFGVKLDFTGRANYDTETWSQEALSVYDALIFDGYLGTGRYNDYAGAKASVVWAFRAGEGRTIETLDFKAEGRTIGLAMDWSIRVLVSVDEGESFTLAAEEKLSSKTSFSYDLTNLCAGEDTVQVKLMLWGSYWHTVGLKNLEISGTYRYDITYDAGEGTIPAENPTSYVKPAAEISLLPAVAPDYYLFDGWYASPDFSGSRVESIAAGSLGAISLYAKYLPEAYRILYHLNGGKQNADNPASYQSVSGLTLSSPTRTGYTFGGWYADASADGERVTEIAAGTRHEVELYAKWLKNFRLTYVLNGGTLEDKVEAFTAEDSILLASPIRDGYTFDGWFTDADMTQPIESLPVGTEENVTVYAKWVSKGDGNTESGCNKGAAELGIFALLAVCAAWKRRF